MRISRLLILGGILTSLLPVALLAIGYTIKTRALMLDTTLEQNELFAGEAALYIDRVLTDHSTLLQLIARGMGQDALESAEVTPTLERLRQSFPLFDRLLVAAPDGIVRISVPDTADNGQKVAGVSIADRRYFQTVLRTNAAYIDPEVLLGRTSGTPVMIIAAPIPGADGRPVAVLVGTIELDTLTQLIGRLHVGTSGHAVAVTRDGVTVAHPNPQLVQQRFNFSASPIWPHLRDARQGRIDSYQDETNVTRFAAFATVPSTGWKLWLSQQRDELDSEFYALLASTSIWPFAAVALGIVLAFGLSRMIARPIENLHETAEEIAAGDLNRRAEVAGPAELSSLAAALNSMAQSLQDLLHKERGMRELVEKSVLEYSRFAARVAAGDFSAQVSASDIADLAVLGNAADLARLGEGLNTMSRSLGLLVSEIKMATTQLGSATSEILSATTQQAAATSEEAAAVRQMAASVHELRQAADSVSRRTQTVVDMAQKTEAVAETGLESVEETIRSAEQGRQRLETLAERVMGFSERTHEIAEINAAVGELAEKSNLLAVNASIEAAKAGEAGLGFAVVANEIKELADQSKTATTQVRRILADIQRSAQAAVIAAEQYAKASDAGVATSRQSGSAISTLAGRVTEASQAARQNLAAAEQQQAGIEQIALAVGNIESSSAQTVAATAQVEQSARSLHDLAQGLEVIVGRVSVQTDGERKVP